MSKKKTALLAVLLSATLVMVALCSVKPSAAHGSMQNPVSRIYNCYLEGPEHPVSTGCQAAVAAGGTQALYDWNAIRQANANGNSQAIIPDGKLCSANNDEFKGFDLARADWVATTLTAGSNYTFTFNASAGHRGTMDLFVTKDGYDPTQPLKWSDLEATPFSSHATDANANSTSYTWTATLPANKSGRHVIYMIWQRSDSPEAFYSCSDVIFTNGGATSTPLPTPTPKPVTGTPTPTAVATATPTVKPTATATATPKPATVTPTATPKPATVTPPATAKPTATATPKPATVTPTVKPTATPTQVGSYPAWAPNTAYTVGTIVSYNGANYKCLQSHTSQVGWEPSNVPALWQKL